MGYDNVHLLMVDNQAYVTDAFEAYLTTLNERFRVSTATSMPQALAVVEAAEDLAVVLLDLQMPGVGGTTGIHRLLAIRPDMRIAVISGDASVAAARAALQAGAAGFIPKTMSGPAVVAAIRLVHSGERYFPIDALHEPAAASAFTPREREVLNALVGGKANKEIAAELRVGPGAVALHLTNIYRKLDVRTRGQAVRQALALGLHATSGRLNPRKLSRVDLGLLLGQISVSLQPALLV
jgi:two-component system, NarL family, nitrate/nitrite response regulator NarL